MNNHYYLSVMQNPEFNLELIAKHKVFFTEELQECREKLNDLKLKQFYSIAATVTTLGIGIILGISISITLGAIIGVIAIIPLSIWHSFQKPVDSAQINLNKEIEKTANIYQNISVNLKVRLTFVKSFIKGIINAGSMAQGNLKCDSQKINEFSQFLENQLNDLNFENVYINVCADLDDPNSQVFVERNKLFGESMNLLKKSIVDIKVDMKDLIGYAQYIVKSNLQPQETALKSRWEELTKSCEELAKPYASYWAIENGSLVYKG